MATSIARTGAASGLPCPLGVLSDVGEEPTLLGFPAEDFTSPRAGCGHVHALVNHRLKAERRLLSAILGRETVSPSRAATRLP